MTHDLPDRLDAIEDTLATIAEALLDMREDARLPRLRADAGVAALTRPHHHYRCEAGSNAKASGPSSPRKPEGPGGCPTGTLQGHRPGVESSESRPAERRCGDGDGRGRRSQEPPAARAIRPGTAESPLSERGARFMLFDHRGETLSVVLWFGMGPWFACADLARLSEPPPEDLADLPAAVERRIPVPHRNTVRSTDTGAVSSIVDETGAALLLDRWTTAMDRRDADALRRWLAETVIPSAHALMLREERIEPESPDHAPFPQAPTEVVADAPGLFKVYAGDLNGRDCLMVNAREIYKSLGFRQPYSGWFEDRGRGFGFRNGVQYSRVMVTLRQYDHYLTLDAADSLLCQESHPKAIEARAYLQKVARERAGVIEGVATRVEEKPGLPALPTFPDDGLVTVTPGEIGGKPCMVVNGLELHDRLGARRDFSTWIKGRIAKYGFVEDEDYETSQVIDSSCSPKRGSRNSNLIAGANRITYTLTLEMAKELAMVENNAMGRKIRRYFIKCERLVLDFYRDAASRVAAPVPVAPADTPPHQPLIIPFKAGTKEIPVRVAIRAGRPWFLAFDVALIADEPHDDPRPAFAGVPEAYRDLRPSPDGESAALWVDEAGLAYFLGARPHKPAAERLRDWLLKVAKPALRERLGALPKGVAAASAVPPEDHYTHRDPLYLGCLAVSERLFRAGETRKTGGHALSDNYGRFLAWLWRNAPAEEGWLKIGNTCRLAEVVGLPRRSLARAIGRAVAWGLAEQRPERPDGWPTDIRLAPDRLAAALDAAGLAWRG